MLHLHYRLMTVIPVSFFKLMALVWQRGNLLKQTPQMGRLLGLELPPILLE